MKTLAIEFEKSGFCHRQRVREGDLAIYERWREGQKAPSHFEVIRIRRHNGFVIRGKKTEPAEFYPDAEKWGLDGFTVPTFEAAQLRLARMMRDAVSDPKDTCCSPFDAPEGSGQRVDPLDEHKKRMIAHLKKHRP